jgi:hypothetical protein
VVRIKEITHLTFALAWSASAWCCPAPTRNCPSNVGMFRYPSFLRTSVFFIYN